MLKIYDQHTDLELIALLKSGDKGAFECIYSRYATTMFRYARKTISDKEDCEEIVQEVFISLWERHASLRILSLKHYLFKAVRYKVIHHIRHHKIKMKYEEHFRLFEAMYESLEPEQRSIEAIQSSLIQLLEELPERCQVALKLRILENLSNAEIAARMNITKKRWKYTCSAPSTTFALPTIKSIPTKSFSSAHPLSSIQQPVTGQLETGN